MNSEDQNVSRRKFLAAGSAIVATSLLTKETNAAFGSVEPLANAKRKAVGLLISDDPVTTEATQTLKNKKISILDGNVLGTNSINIKESSSFPTTGNDITAALNWAISTLNGVGGHILIPAGVWTSNGGHDFHDAITIEGVGQNFDSGQGTEIKMNSNSSYDYMFRITGSGYVYSLKNLRVNFVDKANGIGLLIQNTSSDFLYGIYVENVTFRYGAYGIKIDSTSGEFECELSRFERVNFIGCRIGFSCNTVNGGYSFDSCYFGIPTSGEGTPAGTAFDIATIGNLAVENCLFAGGGPSGNNEIPTDGTTILITRGEFHNISFYNCQDEKIQFAYQNVSNQNYSVVPLVYRNCLLQSKLKFYSDGSVVFDSCYLHVTNNARQVEDSTGIFVKVFLKGLNYVYSAPGFTVGKLTEFSSPYSRVIDEAGVINPDITTPTIDGNGNQIINSSVGTVTVGSGNSYVVIYNVYATDSSIIFLQLKTYDSGGARIRNVVSYNGYFIIYLTQNAASNLDIAFEIKVLKP